LGTKKNNKTGTKINNDNVSCLVEHKQKSIPEFIVNLVKFVVSAIKNAFHLIFFLLSINNEKITIIAGRIFFNVFVSIAYCYCSPNNG
jgi:hypothetical protein